MDILKSHDRSQCAFDFLEIKQIFTDGTGLAMKQPYGQVIKD
jgi:hypothetical protein